VTEPRPEADTAAVPQPGPPLLEDALAALLEQQVLDRARREDDAEQVFRLELRADAAHEGVLLLRVLVVLLGLCGLLLLR